MKRVYKSPENIEHIDKNVKTIFLAGSIDMDRAIDWQKRCEEKLSHNYILFNPRRDSWDSSWKQTIENVGYVLKFTTKYNFNILK